MLAGVGQLLPKSRENYLSRCMDLERLRRENTSQKEMDKVCWPRDQRGTACCKVLGIHCVGTSSGFAKMTWQGGKATSLSWSVILRQKPKARRQPTACGALWISTTQPEQTLRSRCLIQPW